MEATILVFAAVVILAAMGWILWQRREAFPGLEAGLHYVAANRWSCLGVIGLYLVCNLLLFDSIKIKKALPYLALVLGAGIIFLLACRFPSFGRRAFRRAELILARMAGSRWIYPSIFLGYLAFSFLVAVPLRQPEPVIHDEFSYLLAADTFAHGRLANPPHPFWKHFETFHVLQQPTYVSKYPPAQGLFLALGQVLWRPVLGVWISTALAGAAVFWMLSGLFRKSWALIGTLLILTNPQVLGWNWRFWGGSVALLGGALLLGGFWRNLKEAAVPHSLAAGLGMGILALSRPFEGAVFSFILVALTLYFCWRNKTGISPVLWRILVPMAAALAPFLAFQVVYDLRTTGNPLLMPYVVYERQYTSKPMLTFLSDRDSSPHYNNPEMERFYKNFDADIDSQRRLSGLIHELLHKTSDFKAYFWDLLFLIFLFPLAFMWRTRLVVRLSFCVAAVMAFVAVMAHRAAFPHYYAAVMPLFVILICFGLRQVRVWSFQGRRFGLLAMRLLVIYMCVYSLAIFLVRRWEHQNQYDWHYQRADLLARLESDGQKHLVIVKYGPLHDPNEEWVYNRADIDHAPVVWARDLGDNEDQKLMDYFKGYQVTILEPDSLK